MSYNQNFVSAVFFFAAILFLYPFVSSTPKSAEKTRSPLKFVKILMRRSVKYIANKKKNSPEGEFLIPRYKLGKGYNTETEKSKIFDRIAVLLTFQIDYIIHYKICFVNM